MIMTTVVVGIKLWYEICGMGCVTETELQIIDLYISVPERSRRVNFQLNKYGDSANI